MNSTSPPAGVQARPTATPGSFVRFSISSSRKVGAPSISTTTSGVMTIRLSSPSARLRATLRHKRANFSFEVADACLAGVAADNGSRIAASVNSICSAVRP